MRQLSCAGTGLVSLDIVVTESSSSPLFIQAGGSCGNVLAILAYFGWVSHPFARFRNDTTAHFISLDLSRWGVDCSYLLSHITGSTPTIVHRIGRNDQGRPWHRFEWFCPKCKNALPRYRPILARDISSLQCEIPSAQVFYFDRVSRGTIELAKLYKKNGALIFFEPTSVKDDKMFAECLSFVDVIKYASGKRVPLIQKMTAEFPVSLEIVTLGEDGVKFRHISKKCLYNPPWVTVKGYELDDICDAGGAGDWCSAALIDQLFRTESELCELSDDDLVPLFAKSQAYSAINCLYPGARGAMHFLSQSELNTTVMSLISKNIAPSVTFQKLASTISLPPRLCPLCK